jgi:hypothetical protein
MENKMLKTCGVTRKLSLVNFDIYVNSAPKWEQERNNWHIYIPEIIQTNCFGSRLSNIVCFFGNVQRRRCSSLVA